MDTKYKSGNDNNIAGLSKHFSSLDLRSNRYNEPDKNKSFHTFINKRETHSKIIPLRKPSLLSRRSVLSAPAEKIEKLSSVNRKTSRFQSCQSFRMDSMKSKTMRSRNSSNASLLSCDDTISNKQLASTMVRYRSSSNSSLFSRDDLKFNKQRTSTSNMESGQNIVNITSRAICVSKAIRIMGSKRRQRTQLDTIAEYRGNNAIPKKQTAKFRRRKTKLMALASIITRIHKEEERARLIAKFRRLAKFLIVLFGLWKIHAKRVANFLETNVDLIDVDEPVDLMFDASQYKASKKAFISQETIRILKIRPDMRTEDEVKYVQTALGNYPSIADYPSQMKRLMAQRSWYEKYDRKRIIIQEGHPARCYYFILAGSVVVSRHDNSKISTTVCFLRRGDNFGELGLINNKPRRASVISKEAVELLVFSDEDYMEIFMSGGLKNSQDSFLKNIPCLKTWPLEKLSNTPDNAFLTYFKRDIVLVHNSRYSEWIYIIKSGSCTIYKKLVKVKPKTGYKFIPYKPPKITLSENVHRKQLEERMDKETSKLDKLSLLYRQRFMQDLDLGIATIPYQTHDANHKPEEEEDTVNSNAGVSEANQTQGNITQVDNKPKRVVIVDPYQNETHLPIINDKSKPSPDKKHKALKKGIKPSESNMASLQQEVKKAQQDLKKKLETREQNLTQKKLSIAEALNDDFLHLSKEATEADYHPQFVRVKTLTAGSVFGLTSIVHQDQPSFSLVSDGAECIMIKKKFFIDNAPKDYLRTMAKEISPYPKDDVLQDALQVYVDWSHIRNDIIKQTFKGHKVKGMKQF